MGTHVQMPIFLKNQLRTASTKSAAPGWCRYRMGPGIPSSSLPSCRDLFPWLQEPGLAHTFARNKIIGGTDNSWPV